MCSRSSGRGPMPAIEGLPRLAPRPASSDGPDEVLGRRVIGELFGQPAERSFAVRYWTGSEEAPPGGAPAFTLVFRRPGTLRRTFLPPSELTLADEFARGEVDVEGDLEAAAALPEILAARLRSPARLARVVLMLLRLPRDGGPAPCRRPGAGGGLPRMLAPHGRARDTAAIRFHYDIGNDFYQLWLDRRMVYSCGYFPTGLEDLDAAQEAKLDHVCRKLRLATGERLLDIGCGWGALALHAVRHYGADALGITLSPAQAAHARQQISAEGLEGRCRVEVRDYRDLRQAGGFDKVASVGMFEHVGPRRLQRYFEIAARLTRPGGLFLNHGIVTLDHARRHPLSLRFGRRLVQRGEFIGRYIFPGGELVPLAEALAGAEAAGFETRDVESLREHYAATLRHWRSRLEARRPAAVAQVGEATYRVWRLYLAGCAHAFARGSIGIVQMLLAKPDAQGRCALPGSRRDLYPGPPSGDQP